MYTCTHVDVNHLNNSHDNEKCKLSYEFWTSVNKDYDILVFLVEAMVTEVLWVGWGYGNWSAMGWLSGCQLSGEITTGGWSQWPWVQLQVSTTSSFSLLIRI